jgi:hypothetical protein
MSAPDQNPADVVEFFEKTIPDQIHLTAIDPEKRRPVIARDFGSDVTAAVEWALECNTEGRNVYYTVNCVRTGVNTKPRKDDIVAVRFAHVDVDPPKGAASFTVEEREAAYERLLAAAPTTINWSGNGWQALWRLDTGTSVEEVESINLGLIDALGGDVGTHDVSRLLRVPGLINWPDERKRGIGRQPVLSAIVIGDAGAVADAAELLARYPATRTDDVKKRQSRGEIDLGNMALISADDLGLPPEAHLRRIIEEPKGLDRSADTFQFACEALRQGLTEQQVAGVLLNDANAISAHCLDQDDPERAARRAIEAALGKDEIREFARKHAREGERRLAAEEGVTDDTKIWTLEDMQRDCVFIEDGSQVADTTRRGCVLSLHDFKTSTAASTVAVQVPTAHGGYRTKLKRVAEVWLEHPNRRTVTTQTFKAGAGIIADAPSGSSAINSWRGFRMMVPPEDCEIRVQPLLDHIKWLFGDQADLFLDWLAHTMQRPGELPSIAFIHIAPKTGMGRNLISSVIGRVFVGYAALSYNLSASLSSGFNGLLAGKVFAVVDEIDEGGLNRKYQLQQDLKQLVTEETRSINIKFGRQYVEWNACRWLIFSNSEAAIPLEDADRRFVVVRCDDDPKSDEYYFRLYQLRDDPSFIASFAEYLRQRDLSSFKAGMRAPMTAAKQGLLERSRSEAEQTLLNIVERWPVDVITAQEIDNALGEDRPSGAAKRYMFERAGLIRLRVWKEPQQCGLRPRVTAYAVRNSATWKEADITALRAEIGRADSAAKECALYGVVPTDVAAPDPSDPSDPLGLGV